MSSYDVNGRNDESTRTLLIIAHPDDEVMFFTPLLLSFKGRNGSSGAHGESIMPSHKEIHVLCLSTGNFEGLGSIRSAELTKCLALFGIPESHITIIDDPLLPDSMTEDWPEDYVAAIVSETIDKIHPQHLYTFDSYGVSGHPNHIATYLGVRRALLQKTGSSYQRQAVKGWKLRSKSVFRKFLGILDLLLSFIFCRTAHTIINLYGLYYALKGMYAHKSQNALYRQCFVVLSTFSYFNEFDAIV